MNKFDYFCDEIESATDLRIYLAMHNIHGTELSIEAQLKKLLGQIISSADAPPILRMLSLIQFNNLCNLFHFIFQYWSYPFCPYLLSIDRKGMGNKVQNYCPFQKRSLFAVLFIYSFHSTYLLWVYHRG